MRAQKHTKVDDLWHGFNGVADKQAESLHIVGWQVALCVYASMQREQNNEENPDLQTRLSRDNLFSVVRTLLLRKHFSNHVCSCFSQINKKYWELHCDAPYYAEMFRVIMYFWCFIYFVLNCLFPFLTTNDLKWSLNRFCKWIIIVLMPYVLSFLFINRLLNRKHWYFSVTLVNAVTETIAIRFTKTKN